MSGIGRAERTAIRNNRHAQAIGAAPERQMLNHPRMKGAAFYQEALTDLKSIRKYANNSFARFFHNSKDYDLIQKNLRSVTDALGETMSGDAAQNKEKLEFVQGLYKALIESCETYLENKKDRQTSGNIARKEKVGLILSYAKMDAYEIERVLTDAEVGTQSLENLNWQEILQEARTSTMEVDDISKLKTFGSANKTGDNAGRILENGAGRFTHEEIGKGPEATFYDNSYIFDSEKREKEGRSIFGYKEGTKYNKSKRNVAMYEVAKLMNLDNLIAKSEYVKIYDKASNTMHRGNLMAEASGKSGKAVAAEGSSKIKAQNTDNIEERERMAKAMTSPSLQKELTSLQVLDFICGQGDRHMDNFFMRKDESAPDGGYAHITGIDNDEAFSTGFDWEQFMKLEGLGAAGVQKLRNVASIDGTMQIPLMDKALAQRILNISDSELKMVLLPWIEPEMIDFTLKRLKLVKDAINNTGIDSDRFVTQWNDETHKRLMMGGSARKLMNSKYNAGKSAFMEKGKLNGATNEDNLDFMRNESYYSQFIQAMTGFDYYGSDVHGTLNGGYRKAKDMKTSANQF